MNKLRTRKAALRGSIGTVVIVLLFAFSAAVYAQNKKDERKGGGGGSAPAASHQAPAQAPVRQAPAQAPVRQAPSQPTPSNTGQSGRQSGGQTGGQNNGQFSRQGGGQTGGQNNGQFGRQNTGQTASPNNSQQGRQGGGQTGGQNNGQFGRQNTGQTASPNNSQQGRQGGGQTGGQNNGQQFGRQGGGQTGGQNAGQQFGRQGGGQNGGRGQSQVTRFPNGRPQSIRTANGGMVNRDQAGRVREVHTAGGAVITHRPDGVRRVEVARPGNLRIVAGEHGRGGYAQRPLMVRNQSFVQRTYYDHGRAYARVYRPVTFRGVALNLYTPTRFYRPAFYSYAYSPWMTPVSYSWGWAGTPWYGYYGGYFSPYRVYAGPAFWLTDYLFAMTLQEAYQERLDAGLQGASYAGGQASLTPDVKQAVADEVHRQLDLERIEGQSTAGDMTPIFSDNISHVFVVSDALMVDDRGPGCPVTEGDVLQLRPGSSNGESADVVVLASKGTDCRRGSLVSVQLQDLQEMQNHMRATIDQGLAEMQSRQGKGGLPPLPAAAAAPPVDSAIAASVQPDANVASELSQAAQEADTGEQEVVSQSADADAGNAAGPVTISLGQSMADVESINGKPEKIIDLGAKKIYVYKDLKITFTDGRVSDVQ